MTWTFNETLSTDLDRLRFLIGDTDATDQQLQDEALTFLLTEEGGLYPAAAAACRSLVAHYARRVDVSNAGASLAASQRVEHYTRLSLQYARRSAGGPAGRIGTPVVGGVSASEVQAAREDSDLVQPSMRHDMHETPGTDET